MSEKIVSRETGDTIMAPMTPLVASAAIVVRISGNLSNIHKFFNKELSPRKAILTKFQSKLDTNISDSAIAIFYPAPNSYTGEDVLEISFHGNPLIVSTALKDFSSAGVRFAEAGEFTKRAVLNGKISISQAEAVDALTNAPTSLGIAKSQEVLEGALQKEVSILWKKILNILAVLEAEIDFSEELEDDLGKGLECEIKETIRILDGLTTVYENSRMAFVGAKVVIAGAANSGKSTLFNALLKEDLAIVSDEAGTTRDINKGVGKFGGVAFTLIDTAGFRQSDSKAEIEGMRRSQVAVASADILIETCSPENMEAIAHHNKIMLLTKADLYKEKFPDYLRISTKTGEGMSDLIKRLEGKLSVKENEMQLIVNERQYINCLKARDFLKEALFTTKDIATHNLKLAAAELSSLDGIDISEETLNIIFSKFCIGK